MSTELADPAASPSAGWRLGGHRFLGAERGRRRDQAAGQGSPSDRGGRRDEGSSGRRRGGAFL